MPRVENYQPDQQFSQPTPTVQASEVANGGQALAQGIQNLGQSFENMQRKYDDAAATEAFTQFERDSNSALFDPERGYFYKQGKNAYLDSKPTHEYIEKKRTEYANALKSPGARQAFLQAADAQIRRTRVSIDQHAAKGLEVYNDDARKSLVENTLENASLYWNDEEKLQVQRYVGLETVREMAEQAGIDPVEKMQNYNSQFARSAILRATAESPDQGQQYLEKYSELLEGSEHVQLQATIAKARKAQSTKVTASQAVSLARQIVSQYEGMPDARKQALKDVEAIEDGQLYKETQKEVIRQINLYEDTIAEHQARLYESVEADILKGKMSITEYKAENPDEWESLTPKQQKELESDLSKEQPIDHKFRADVETLPDRLIAALDLAEYRKELSAKDYLWLVDRRKSALEEQSPVRRQLARSNAQRINDAADRLFGNYSDLKKADTEDAKELMGKHGAFHQVITEEYESRKKIKGSDLDAKEFTEMLNGITRDVARKGILWGTNNINISELTAEQTTLYSRVLQEMGEKVTADALLKMPVIEEQLRELNLPLTTNNFREMARQIAEKQRNRR